MISRVAEHCFWFGRYLERAESTARVLGVTSHLATDAGLTPGQTWHPVVIVSGEEEPFTARFGPEALADGEAVQRYLTWDGESPVSIRCTVGAARLNARSIREVVSLEAWETVNELHLWVDGPRSREAFEQDRYGFYRQVRNLAQLCLGHLRSTMLHDEPLEFMRLGVNLERGGQTARILDVHHHLFTALEQRHDVVETALWLGLLRACSGYEPFMKRHHGLVNGEAVAAFLMLEPRFPRSVRYAVHNARERLEAIRPPEDAGLPGQDSVARLGTLDGWLGVLPREPFETRLLHERLTHVVDEAARVGSDIAREFFGQGPV
ncbi:MAG: alpha-E domain-containing protein [Deltaproteobacteria bacterium]|nr:alpha-E domain-containing protein [Deltaproteobacteria bacterium]